MDYDVYLYNDSSDEAVAEGSDHLWRGLDYQEAIAYAREQVVAGFYARAIVGQGKDVHEVYDTANDLDLLGGPPLPSIAPGGQEGGSPPSLSASPHKRHRLWHNCFRSLV